MPILIYLGPSTRDNKKLMAVFANPKKTIHFGQKGSETFTEGASSQKRLNYLKRHKVNEDWENPLTAGSLSRFILWGSSRNIDDNIKKYVRRFKIKDNRK
ncbi:DUF5754 family protein [Haliea sp.]|uniref:DUF5754 family protein n=1 Tax=Haliea sp. TaxID=1932666 RepID=UPI00338FC959